MHGRRAIATAIAATVAGLRGCSADVVIMEEAAFMSPELFYQVVVPSASAHALRALLGVKNTALLGISTPQDEFNYYTELMNLKDQWGEFLFLNIKLGMICNSCAKNGTACTHKLSMNPHWKPPERTAKVDAVMSCNPVLRDRETRGVVSSTKRFLVTETEVDDFAAREEYDFPDGKPDVLYTSIDPSGGGAGSDYAIVTMALHQGRPIVVGIDKSGSSDPVVIQQMIHYHVRGIRDHPRYSKCHVRVFVEANMSWTDCERIANQLHHESYSPIEVVRNDDTSAHRFGIWTSQDTKEGYAIEIQRSINLMSVAQHFISEKRSVNIAALVEQLRNFRREIVAPSGDSSVALHYRVVLTGKSSGKKDDLVMALGIALYYMQRSQRDSPFREFCRLRGISSN